MFSRSARDRRCLKMLFAHLFLSAREEMQVNNSSYSKKRKTTRKTKERKIHHFILESS
jgi:hypothetical protein